MSYTALYRKLRPKSFLEVSGQDAVITALKNQVKNNKIAHAYIFSGTRGTGKTSVAKIMARAVNCENQKDGNPCNECETCKTILKEASINILEMDAASNTGIEDIRQVKEQTKYPPTSGKYRVFIIDEVHMLSNQAFNGLLKTLEEPPEYVIFILATTEIHKVPITVLSRCQRYDFKRISVECIEDRIKEVCKAEDIDIEDKAARYIARIADGAMRDALSLLDECLAFAGDEKISYNMALEVLGLTDNEEFESLLKSIIDVNILKALEIIENLLLSGKELSQFVNDFLWYLRNMLMLKTSEETKSFIDLNEEVIDRMILLSNEVSKETLMRFIRILSELYNNLRNALNKRVLLELAIIKLMSPEMEENNEAIVDRLSRIESKLKTPSLMLQKEVNNIIIKDELKEEIEEKKEIQLSKVSYDDLQMLKKDWEKIVSKFSGAFYLSLKEACVEAFNDEKISLIYKDKVKADFINKDRLVELKSMISSLYNKEFDFEIIYNKDSVPNRYKVKDISGIEEIKEKINFNDIEIENY